MSGTKPVEGSLRRAKQGQGGARQGARVTVI